MFAPSTPEFVFKVQTYFARCEPGAAGFLDAVPVRFVATGDVATSMFLS